MGMDSEVSAISQNVIKVLVVVFLIGVPTVLLEFTLLKRLVPCVFRLGFPLLRARYPWAEGREFTEGHVTTENAEFRFASA